MKKRRKEFWRLVWGETRFQKTCSVLGILSLASLLAAIIYNLATSQMK